MTSQQIPDAMLIPARAECILARRWTILAAQERKRHPPSYAYSQTVAAPQPRPLASAPHHSTRVSQEHQATVLDRLAQGKATARQISLDTGIGDNMVRSYLRRLEAKGQAVTDERFMGLGGWSRVWRLAD